MLRYSINNSVAVWTPQHVMIEHQVVKLGRLLKVGAEGRRRVLEVARLSYLICTEVEDVQSR